MSGAVAELFTQVSFVGLFLRLAAFGAAAGLVAWLLSRLIHSAWALGRDPRRNLARAIAPTRALLGLAVLWLSLWPITRQSPAATAAIVLGGLLAASTWGVRLMRDVVAGVSLALAPPFAIGDEVSGDGFTGRVIGLGLTRVILQSSAGDRLALPASEVVERRLRFAGSGGALPVEVTVAITATPHGLAAIRDQALLCPYADPGAPVIVELLDAGHVRIAATPVHPDEADELRSDLVERILELTAG